VLRHALKALPAGSAAIAIGFTIASYGAHLRLTRVDLVMTCFLWLVLIFCAIGWAYRSDQARKIAEPDQRDEP
jgi:hypothetical protein